MAKTRKAIGMKAEQRENLINFFKQIFPEMEKPVELKQCNLELRKRRKK